MQPTATTACGRPVALRSAASSSVSTESFFADSTKPQVFTTTVSASSGSSTSRKPPGQLLGVDLVAGAPEGDDGDREEFLRIARHNRSSIPAIPGPAYSAAPR